MAVARVVQMLRERVVRAELETTTDAQLLQWFIAERDEAAFAALVRRHGAMVWGVCQRILRQDQDAEDAFQATFIVLLRKAASIHPPSMLGNWLYGVAHQVSVKARAMNAKRMIREKQSPLPLANAEAKQDPWRELKLLLDQELSLLPEKYRAIIVLCDLEGKTRKEAAAQLAVPEGTVAGRQARARAMLAKRLARRGVTVSAATLAGMMADNAVAAAAPASAVASTIKSASVVAAGGVISANVAALAEGVVKSMFLSKLKSVLTVVLVVLGLGMTTFGLSVLADGWSNGQRQDSNVLINDLDGKAEKPKETAQPPAPPKQQPVEPNVGIGFLKVEARGQLIRKGTNFHLLVQQHKLPPIELLIRSNADKSALTRTLFNLKDQVVVVTGNVVWLPKGHQINSDDDYALGIVYSEEPQVKVVDSKDIPLDYLKVEAKGVVIWDEYYQLHVRLQEKPAQKLVFGFWIDEPNPLLKKLHALKNREAVVTGSPTWQPKSNVNFGFTQFDVKPADDREQKKNEKALEPAIERELARLAGDWNLLSLVINGKNLDAKEGFTVKGDTLTSKAFTAAVKVIPEASPPAIDIIVTSGETKGQILKGIYKIEGNFLTLCSALADADRPAAFKSTPGSQTSLAVYQRAGTGALQWLTPAEIIKTKPAEKIGVELRVADVGVIRGPVPVGGETEPILLLSPDDNKGDDTFSILVLGQAVRHLKRVGIENPREHLRGKVVRVTGTVRVTPRSKGTGYELWVESLDQFESVQKK